MEPSLHDSAPQTRGSEPIIVYFIDRHPLARYQESGTFQWLEIEDDGFDELEGIIGPFNPQDVRVMRDQNPAGPAWRSLLDGLVDGDIRTVITHLAPLSSGQRQQLIGVCATTGARLITPGDGGRNSTSSSVST